jgi:hypothetical protein
MAVGPEEAGAAPAEEAEAFIAVGAAEEDMIIILYILS